MKKYNYIVSVVMIAIGGYIFYEASGYTVSGVGQKNPAVWPMFLAGALILLSVALIIETIFHKETEEEKERVVIDWKSPGMIRVYIALGLMIVFVILMNVIGMLLSLLIMIPVLMWIMGCRSTVGLIVFPIAMCVFVYVFFVIVMKITLPQPIWM